MSLTVRCTALPWRAEPTGPTPAQFVDKHSIRASSEMTILAGMPLLTKHYNRLSSNMFRELINSSLASQYSCDRMPVSHNSASSESDFESRSVTRARCE